MFIINPILEIGWYIYLKKKKMEDEEEEEEEEEKEEEKEETVKTLRSKSKR